MSRDEPSADSNGDIVSCLVRWYLASHRELPWRRDPDPYRVWISEAMLQQTTVKTVLGYYARFLERFPSIAALAAAREADVVAAWSGLGYYSRARNLRAAARVIVSDHGGRFPDDPAAVGALPGFGPYTTGAVLSIAFGRRVPLVDGNVARVLSRLFLVRGDPKSKRVRERLWSIAGELVLLAPSPSDWNQSLMELGALVCSPRRPACLLCPVAALCLARRSGLEEILPEKASRPASRAVVGAAVVARRGDKVLLVRRSEDEAVLPGLWEPPGVLFWEGSGKLEARALEAAVESGCGVSLRVRDRIAEVAHSITTRRLTTSVFAGDIVTSLPSDRSRVRWVDPKNLDSLPLSSLARKILRAALGLSIAVAPEGHGRGR
jgi:A/G-specific adenine glycosylase